MKVTLKNIWQPFFGMLMKDLAWLFQVLIRLFVYAFFEFTRIFLTHVMKVSILFVSVIE